MPVSGKTTPDNIPYLLESDIPDMGAGDKAIAERVQAIFAETDRQPLSWLKSGAKKQLIVCNASGVPQYVTLGGDATIDETGNLQLGAGVVGTNEMADGAGTSRKIKPSIQWVSATNTLVLASDTALHDVTGASITLELPVTSVIEVAAQFFFGFVEDEIAAELNGAEGVIKVDEESKPSLERGAAFLSVQVNSGKPAIHSAVIPARKVVTLEKGTHTVRLQARRTGTNHAVNVIAATGSLTGFQITQWAA